MESSDEAYTEWSTRWGLALTYGLVQQVEPAEQALAEAIVAESLRDHKDEERIIRFAKTLYQMACKRTISGFGADDFYRLPNRTRAAVMLKVKGRFSRRQIAAVLDCKEIDVDLALEQARYSFTRGKPWLSSGAFRRQLDDAKLVAPCPDPQDGRLFARYLESDMSSEETLRLHKHYVSCTLCRTNLSQFKNTYSDWLFSLPEPEVTKSTQNFIKKTVAQGRKASMAVRNNNGPSAMPGLRKLFSDRQTLLLILSAVLFMWLCSLMRA